MSNKKYSRLSKDTIYHYHVFGLHIESTFYCPELFPFESNQSQSDVKIHFGDVPDELPNPILNASFVQAKVGSFLLKLDEVANFLVTNGQQIIIEPAQGHNPATLRLYLFSTVFASLLHQRGQLILHASAIETKVGAVLFMGHSGAGKSTLAATFMKAGYRLIAEDVSAITQPTQAKANSFKISPGLAQIRLWRDAIQNLNFDTASGQKSWYKEDKYTYFLKDKDEVAKTSSKVHTIYLLRQTDTEHAIIETLPRKDQFKTIMQNIFRREYVQGLGVQQRVFEQTTELLQKHVVKCLVRPKNQFSVDTLVKLVEQDLLIE